MKVYSIVERHDLYTLYEKVDLEDCADDFITEEEFGELPDSATWGYREVGVLNVTAFNKLVGEVVQAYTNRKEGRKTAQWKGERIPDENVRYKFTQELKKHKIKIITGRIWPIQEKEKKIRKDYVRSNTLTLIESYCQDILGLDITFDRKSYKRNQNNAVRFAHNQLKLTVDKLLEAKKKHSLYSGGYNDKELEYCKEWWDEVKDGKIEKKDDE